jgi:hypothetical protein
MFLVMFDLLSCVVSLGVVILWLSCCCLVIVLEVDLSCLLDVLSCGYLTLTSLVLPCLGIFCLSFKISFIVQDTAYYLVLL